MYKIVKVNIWNNVYSYLVIWLFCCVLELITRPKVMESFCCFLKLYSFLNGILVLVAKFVLLFISFFLINSYLFLVDWSLLYNIGLICHTSTRMNHRCTCVPSSGISLPHPMHPHLSRLLQCPSLSSLSPNSKFPLVVYLQMLVYMPPCCSLHSCHPLPLVPHPCP